MTTMKMLEPGVVAQVLGQALGMGRQWVDFLNDCRQGRGQGAYGQRLVPFACTGGTAYRHGTPMYRLKDVQAFVEAVRAAAGVRQPYPLHIQVFAVPDPHGSPAAWRMRRVERASVAAPPGGR